MKCSTAGCNQAAKDRGKCWPHRKWGSSGKPKKYKAPVSQRRGSEAQDGIRRTDAGNGKRSWDLTVSPNARTAHRRPS
jgi:hypothetical protein